MKPEHPKDPLAELLEHLLHPLRSMRRVVGRGAGWSEMPLGLWGVLAFVAAAGTAIYGATLALVLPAGGWVFAAAAVTVSASAGWVLFSIVLSGFAARPAPQIAHACLVTMVFGEAVLELGAVVNLLLWWLGRAPPATALALNVTLVASASLVMLAVLISQLRVIGVRPALVAALWFGIFNIAGIAALRQFYPRLLPF